MKNHLVLLATSVIFLNINSCETTKEQNPVLIENLQEAVDTIPNKIKNAGAPPRTDQLEGVKCGTPTPRVSHGDKLDVVESYKVNELQKHYYNTICAKDSSASRHVIYQYCYKAYSFEDIKTLPDLYGRSYQDYEKMKENNETFHQLCHGLSENLDFLQTALKGQNDFELKEYKDDEGNRYIQYQINGTYFTDRFPLSDESQNRLSIIRKIQDHPGDLKDFIPG